MAAHELEKAIAGVEKASATLRAVTATLADDRAIVRRLLAALEGVQELPDDQGVDVLGPAREMAARWAGAPESFPSPSRCPECGAVLPVMRLEAEATVLCHGGVHVLDLPSRTFTIDPSTTAVVVGLKRRGSAGLRELPSGGPNDATPETEPSGA